MLMLFLLAFFVLFCFFLSFLAFFELTSERGFHSLEEKMISDTLNKRERFFQKELGG